MNILVLGATGATGKEIVAQALEQGHLVTAFVRTPKKQKITHENLRVIIGDARDLTAMSEAVKGQDAVISALGTRNIRETDLITRSMEAIVDAMEHHGIKRLIFMSALGVGETVKDAALPLKIAAKTLTRGVFADKAAGEDYLKNSSLDWTLVYAAPLTNGPKTGNYRTGEHIKTSIGARISRADVADFMLKQVHDQAFIRKAVEISY